MSSGIGIQQLSPLLIDELKERIKKELEPAVGSGGATVNIGEEEPLDTPIGSLWFQTGIGNYEPPIHGVCQPVVMIKNSVISDDEPEEFDKNSQIWFDIEENDPVKGKHYISP